MGAVIRWLSFDFGVPLISALELLPLLYRKQYCQPTCVLLSEYDNNRYYFKDYPHILPLYKTLLNYLKRLVIFFSNYQLIIILWDNYMYYFKDYFHTLPLFKTF